MDRTTLAPVGAGLPAIASFQAINMSNDTPLSLASQLLQGSVYGFSSNPALALALALAFHLARSSVSSPRSGFSRFPPPREAEWRFCAVGNPAWMPG
jgi:hypothetical protein